MIIESMAIFNYCFVFVEATPIVMKKKSARCESILWFDDDESIFLAALILIACLVNI